MQDGSRSTFAVIGAGCIGGTVGVCLSHQRFEVSALLRKPLDKMTLESPEGDVIVADQMLLTTDPALALKNKTVIIISTKRSANAEVALILQIHARRDAVVVVLQNGMNASKEIASYIDNRTDLTFFDAMVSFNAVLVGPGHFKWISKRTQSIIALDGSKKKKLAEDSFCACVRAAGIECYAEEDFVDVCAGKVIINLINAPNALSGVDTFEFLTTYWYRQVWRASILEARAVFRAAGLNPKSAKHVNKFEINHMEQILALPGFVTWIIATVKQIKGGKTSMLQDLESNAAATEVDYLSGKICDLGKEYNIPTPVNAKLVELVKAATAKKQGSPKMSPEQLAEAVGLIHV